MAEYIVRKERITSSDAFLEATREELRTLLAIVADSTLTDTDTIAERAGVSRARAISAQALWEESGVIEKVDTPPAKADTEPTITEEFEERIVLGKMQEVTASECARAIRDKSLAGLLSECAALMGKAALSTEEAKIISSIYTQYSLGEEFIITLAAYILEKKGKLSAVRLGAEAERLVKRGVDTAEELERYISEKENESGAQWEFKRLVGIRGRNLSKKETELIDKWYYEFSYGEDIIGEAYDITVMAIQKADLNYMDKILTRWHESGCKTLEDCKGEIESYKEARAAEEKTKTPPRMPRTPAKEKLRYGDFDVNDVFAKVLARSYGEDDDDTEDNE